MKRIFLATIAILLTFATAKSDTISLGTDSGNAGNWSVWYLGGSGTEYYNDADADTLFNTYLSNQANGLAETLKTYSKDEWPVGSPWPNPEKGYSWIGANDGGHTGNLSGYYAFVLTFTDTLMGQIANIVGALATDNDLFGVYLNGTLVNGAIDKSGNGTSFFQPVDFPDGFSLAQSNNEIVFLVGSWPMGGTGVEKDNPVGLYSTLKFDTNVANESSIAATPEPGTLALFGIGLGGLAFGSFRRKRS